MDLKIVDGDISFVNGSLELVTGKEAIGQHVQMRLSTWLGEEGTVYDTSKGVPYLEVIFAGKNRDLNVSHFIFETVILGTPGVISTTFTLELDNATRVLSAAGTIETIDGNVDFSEVFEVTP